MKRPNNHVFFLGLPYIISFFFYVLVLSFGFLFIIYRFIFNASISACFILIFQLSICLLLVQSLWQKLILPRCRTLVGKALLSIKFSTSNICEKHFHTTLFYHLAFFKMLPTLTQKKFLSQILMKQISFWSNAFATTNICTCTQSARRQMSNNLWC